jgi:hypothetical protein
MAKPPEGVDSIFSIDVKTLTDFAYIEPGVPDSSFSVLHIIPGKRKRIL